MAEEATNDIPAAGGGEANAGDLAAQLKRCAAEREEYLAGWKRAKADLINYQREEASRAEELVRWSNEALLAELVSVVDSFDLAEKVGGGAKGIELIRAQLVSLLKRHGAEPIAVGAAEPFDPARHEAVGEVASEKPAGVVVEEMARGWTLHGKVIRAARVKVSKGQL